MTYAPGPVTGATNTGLTERTGLDILLRSLRRHWRGTSLATILLSSASVAILTVMPSRYSASAYLLLAARPNVVNIQDVVPALALDTEALASQLEILRSRDLATAVARRLALADRNSKGTPSLPPWLHRAAVMAKAWLASASGNAPMTAEERAVGSLLSHQDVRLIGKSRVVEIRYTAASADLARDVANTFAESFIQREVAEKTKASIAAKTWVDGEIARVHREVENNEHKLEDFRARSGLLENGNRLLLPYGQVAELDHRLTQAETQRAAQQARADEVRRLQRSGSLMDALPETIGSPALQAMREREAKLVIDRATLTQQYGPESDRIRRVDGELNDVKAAIRSELSRISAGLDSEAALAANEVASLRAAEAGAKSRLEAASGQSVGLLSLQREVDAGRDLLVTLMRRQNELASQVSLQTADAELISPASLPRNPSFPRLLPMGLLAVVGSALTAVAFNLTRDLKDRLLRSSDDLAGLLAYPVLGLLPKFRTARNAERLTALSADRSRYAEAVKNLFFQIAPSDRPQPRTIVVTSAVSGEGKTTTAVSLAMLAASLGRNVVLVDFDARRPSVHHVLRLPLGPGLMEYFTGEVTALGEIIQASLPILSVIAAGRGSDYNSMVKSELVEALLHSLTQKFDHVIIDTPPCLAVVDPLVVAGLADKVVHVVRWAATTREIVRAAAKLLGRLDPAGLGAVLTQVDTEQHAAEGYGDSVLYHKSLNRYYLG